MTSLKTSVRAYQLLKDCFAQACNLEYAGEILRTDAETAMSAGSGDDRVSQCVANASAVHRLISDRRVRDALDKAEAGAEHLGPDDQRNLALMRHRWLHKAGLPEDLARELARIEADGALRHTRLYKSGDWNTMKDWYAHSFKITREAGETLKDRLGAASAYEARIDAFSPGQKLADIEPELSELDRNLRRMIPEALDRQSRMAPPLPMTGPFPAETQKSLIKEIAGREGFDFNRGVFYFIDGHPSCSGSPDDTRITTRLYDNDFLPGLYGIIHEVGHAVYSQALPQAWRYQPAGHHLGMAVHESQSMIMEYQAGQTAEFLTFLAVRLQDVFNRHGDPAFHPDNIRRLLWKAQASPVRVDADELTYSMHILLRFDLEKKIFDGSLDPLDLPDAWAEGMQARLGIKPRNNAEGCMQDIHWPIGSQGYFSSYTLGAMGAAQFFEAATTARPDIYTELAKGSFTPLIEWLRDNVHSKGSLVTPRELFVQATGEPLNSKPYLNHLSLRYLDKPFAP